MLALLGPIQELQDLLGIGPGTDLNQVDPANLENPEVLRRIAEIQEAATDAINTHQAFADRMDTIIKERPAIFLKAALFAAAIGTAVVFSLDMKNLSIDEQSKELADQLGLTLLKATSFGFCLGGSVFFGLQPILKLVVAKIRRLEGEL